MAVFRFRALLTLDPAGRDGPEPQQYPCGTRSLVITAGRLDHPSGQRCFRAAIYRVDGEPLHCGDRGAVVTIEVTDDHAPEFLSGGQHVHVWNGKLMGHGVISRRVYFTPVG